VKLALLAKPAKPAKPVLHVRLAVLVRHVILPVLHVRLAVLARLALPAALVLHVTHVLPALMLLAMPPAIPVAPVILTSLLVVINLNVY
jgi:hypothetical protein